MASALSAAYSQVIPSFSSKISSTVFTLSGIILTYLAIAEAVGG
jgi:hypothetical protein